MATQYLFSSPVHQGGQYVSYQNNNGYNYVPKNGGFAFRKRFERVDWRKMASVDVEHISRTLDFSVLQENIMNVTFCNIESELDIRAVDPNFVKLFKLAQLTIEYLLYSQEYLAGVCATLEEKGKKREEEEDKLKQELEAVKKELVEVKRESHKRKKLLIAQQQLMHAGAGSYNKCPFCPKAFLNTSFLQAHISRRHGSNFGSASGSGNPSKTSSLDQGVGDSLVNNPQKEAELSHIMERLRATEAKLEEERRLLVSLRNKEERIMPMVVDKVAAASEQQSELHKLQMEEMKDVFLKELQEVNEKYMASERALRELEERYGVKRSYLGVMQDDVEDERELLQQQRAEVAALREQLKYQLESVEEQVQEKVELQKQHQLRSRREPSSREKKYRERAPRGVTEDQVIPVNLKQEKTPVKSPAVAVEVTQQKAVSMYPSDDDDESTALKSGTSSLRTPRTPHSTLGFSGTSSLGLRTSQFLEKLRQNPTMGIMRNELAALLEEKVEKCGIPRGSPGISDQVLQTKLGMQHTQRQPYLQKYPNFMDIREQFNKEATDQAIKKLQASAYMPLRTGSESYPQSAGAHENRPVSVKSRPVGAHSKTFGTTPRSASAPSPRRHSQTNPARGEHQQPQPHPRAVTPQKPALSTGSTTEWTSTQWESDDDDEEDEINISGVKPLSPAPNVRLIQSGPRPSPRRNKQPTIMQAQPLHDDDISDILKSDEENQSKSKTQLLQSRSYAASLSSSAPQPRGQSVADLKRTIEGQLQGRKQDKPFGGVDTISSNVSQKKDQPYLEDLDDASDWDETEEPVQPAVRRAAGGGRETDASSNTFGTSQWGSSSKGASTVKPDVKRSASRNSFVSVTDISSDEDMNIENI